MSDLYFELRNQLQPVMLAGDLSECERIVIERLKAMPSSAFHITPGLAITNTPESVAAYFDNFFRAQPPDVIAAAYTEMNGFDINPDCWFCNAFAYQEYGGHDDYDWLGDYQAIEEENLVITGLERLQEVFAQAKENKEYGDTRDAAIFLVLFKFQDLIRRAAPHMKELRFPLLATAHDHDLIFEVRPLR